MSVLHLKMAGSSFHIRRVESITLDVYSGAFISACLSIRLSGPEHPMGSLSKSGIFERFKNENA